MADSFNVEASRAVTPFFYRAPVPEELPRGMQPMEFQFAGAEYVLARDHALIGDAPGLTKTAQSVMVSNAIEADYTLVVCPASLRLNWEREIWAWSTIKNVSTYPVLSAKDGVNPHANYVIISYDLLRNNAIMDALLAEKWDHLILDEAHFLKNPKGNKRTRAICGEDMLRSVVGRITALSGTILPNQPIEVFNLFRLLSWEAIECMSLNSFRNEFYEEGGGLVRSPVWDPKKQAMISKLHWSDTVRNVPCNLAELQRLLRDNIMVRRLKEQVLHELPPKQWHPFPLTITAAMRKALKHPGWKQAEKLYDLDPSAFNRGIPIDGAVSTARRELGSAKTTSCA